MAASGSWDPYTSLELTHIRSNYCSCVGWAPSKGRRCGWRIDDYELSQARRLLSDMAHKDPHGTDVLKILPSLASLVLCQRHHQYQVPEVVSGFKRRLDSVSVTTNQHNVQVYNDEEASSHQVFTPTANVLAERTSRIVNAKADLPKEETQKSSQTSYENVQQLKQKADAEIASLRKEFARLASVKDDLEQQVKKTRALYVEEKDKNKKLQSETDQLKKTVTKLEADAASHARDRDDLEKLRSENAKLKLAKEASKKSEDATKKEMRSLEAQIDSMTITPPSSADPDATLVGSPSILIPTLKNPSVSTNANVTMKATPKGLTMTIAPMLKMVGRMTRSRASKEQLAARTLSSEAGSQNNVVF